MDLTCKKCGQKYYIPDYKLDDRNIHFFCDRCEHKITVEGQKDKWAGEKKLAGFLVNRKARQQARHDLLKLKSIMENGINPRAS